LIAMTREMGSLGMDVARILESELRVPVVYHEMINNLADKMRLRKSHVIRLLGGRANLFERLTADKTSLSIFTADEMLQVASKGAVMRGWGAAQLLRPVKHAICVRVCAPFELRVKRMMSRLETDDRDAVAAEIRNADESQGAIAKRHFGIDICSQQRIHTRTGLHRRFPLEAHLPVRNRKESRQSTGRGRQSGRRSARSLRKPPPN